MKMKKIITRFLKIVKKVKYCKVYTKASIKTTDRAWADNNNFSCLRIIEYNFMKTFKKLKKSPIKLTSKINKKMYAELSYEANTLHNMQFEHRFSKA